VVHMPNSPHVHVRLGAFKFAFCHFSLQQKKKGSRRDAHRPVYIHGAHGADRTRDLSLTKGVLYH
jgi:hypothetical protein